MQNPWQLENLDPIGEDLGPYQYPFFKNKRYSVSFQLQELLVPSLVAGAEEPVN